MNKISSYEKFIKGGWEKTSDGISFDENSKRIEFLVNEYLVEVAVDKSGWNKLYQDPKDKRFWELEYQFGEMHGGGIPLLKMITHAEAKNKFNI